MSQTKKIYFLSAIVLIIGCYALNLSYSLFVQTEEKNVVDSSVAGISYTLKQNTFAIDANSTKIINLEITNTSDTNINFGILANSDKSNYKVYAVKDNQIYGTLEPKENKTIFLAVQNNNEECITIKFNVYYNYTTVNFDKETYFTKANIDIDNPYDYEFPIAIKDKIINLATNNIDSLRTTLINENIENNDRLLKTIELDDKVSYYFSGDVLDNYMTYNNSCYRIVSIDYDGNIKMTMESDAPCSKDMTVSPFIKKDETVIDSAFGETSDFSKSLIKNYLDEWFNNSGINKDEVVLNNWCLDSKIDNKECNNKYESYVGLLTYDDINNSIYTNNEDKITYLNTNDIWWTLTQLDNQIYTNDLSLNDINKTYKIRPTILIKGDILVKGDGTKTNPYIIDDSLSNKTTCDVIIEE